ncbi:MAG: hypothetical protein FWE82_07245 [Defluviitaleaceae bacterium]|nr:hypothetical protein [Defluviitaleaceae bacterium]
MSLQVQLDGGVIFSVESVQKSFNTMDGTTQITIRATLTDNVQTLWDNLTPDSLGRFFVLENGAVIDEHEGFTNIDFKEKIIDRHGKFLNIRLRDGGGANG